MLYKAVAFRIDGGLPPEAKLLMEDLRLAVNHAVRAGLQSRVTSRYALTKMLYKDFRQDYPGMYSQHLVSSFEVAASLLRNLRRRLSRGMHSRIPFVKRLMMKAENQAYKLDRKEGCIDLPIRAGCHVKLKLVVSDYHRRYLDDPSLSLGSLTLLLDRVIVAFRKGDVRPYVPVTAVSLDTNERSLDGVFVMDGVCTPARAMFPEVAAIQTRHNHRRRRLQRKKAHDRRTTKRMCGREGRRERARVQYRLHQVANAVLDFAEENRSAIVLEDLKGLSRKRRDKVMNRRLSIWPRRRLHRYIEYKASWRGIPVVKVDPYNSSRRCPPCGRIHHSRMGARYECPCGWHADRQVNAGINLLRTAFPEGEAGGLWFSPGAFQHDVMMVLYDPGMGARPEPNGTSPLVGVA